MVIFHLCSMRAWQEFKERQLVIRKKKLTESWDEYLLCIGEQLKGNTHRYGRQTHQGYSM